MRRRTLDALLTTGGLIVAVVLLVVGGLMTWASNFATSQVHDQLADQAITMPPARPSRTRPSSPTWPSTPARR